MIYITTYYDHYLGDSTNQGEISETEFATLLNAIEDDNKDLIDELAEQLEDKIGMLPVWEMTNETVNDIRKALDNGFVFGDEWEEGSFAISNISFEANNKMIAQLEGLVKMREHGVEIEDIHKPNLTAKEKETLRDILAAADEMVDEDDEELLDTIESLMNKLL